MGSKFPRIKANIVEVVDGYTVTVWLRKSAKLEDSALLADEAVDSIERARAIIRHHATEKTVALDEIDEDVEMHDFLPKEENRH